MTLFDGPPIDKHCLVYCGDDRCDCLKGPRGRSWSFPAPLKVKTFTPTTRLRLARPNRTTTEPDRLQQAWQDVENGDLEWRDVPVEIVEGLPPRR